ncbi:type II toxin-antitoxin system PemK/MazF family toxin [Pediococcus ethanolidurans]
MMTTTKPMTLFLVNVPFADQNKAKYRPALVIARGNKVIFIFKITSQYKTKSKLIKNVYYPIKLWRKTGLRKQSYVDIHKQYAIDFKEFHHQKPIGSLTDEDIYGLAQFIKVHQVDIAKINS